MTGTITRRNASNRPQPSTIAASSRSRGIDGKKPRGIHGVKASPIRATVSAPVSASRQSDLEKKPASTSKEPQTVQRKGKAAAASRSGRTASKGPPGPRGAASRARPSARGPPIEVASAARDDRGDEPGDAEDNEHGGRGRGAGTPRLGAAQVGVG